MNAAGIIALVGAYGVSLTTDTKRIIAKPATKLTPELREAIRSHSTELLRVLTHDDRCARFVQILNRLGMRLTIDGNKIVCHGTRGKMIHELRQVIQAHKAALAQILKH